MKLICPACGAIASAESWLNDATCREMLLVLSKLPGPLQKSMLAYLSLFRTGKRALSWKKALRLATEINELATRGYVTVRGQVDRPCSPGIWAAAMEQMIEQRERLSLPMPNHNYLRKVAWDMADRAGAVQEKRSMQTSRQQPRSKGYEADPSLDPLEKARREYDARMAAGEVDKINLKGLLGCVKGME